MTDIATAGRPSFLLGRFGVLPYALTVFLSAALVFLVQPMFAKMAMPVLGGSPSVWNVSLVCFQGALLAGYIYAHILNKLPSFKGQIAIHAAVLFLAALVLPFGLTTAFGDPNPSAPTLWLIGVFALSIAPPFAAISATAPLLQAWYARSGREDAGDPYYLYAASNAGSLIGLVAYPLLMEPLMSLAGQTSAWSWGYGFLALGLIGCGALASISGRGVLPVTAPPQTTTSESKTDQNIWLQRLYWLALAFVPSSLLVGATTHISTDVAAAPFLWAPPLIVYIGSFIVVFSNAGPSALKSSTKALPFAVAAVLMFLPGTLGSPTMVQFAFDLIVLTLAAIVCHGAMAEDRPEVGRLTEFYLIMSLGGVLGGGFNALVAPVIFNTVLEYPLMLALVLFARPVSEKGFPHAARMMAGIAVLIAAGVALLASLRSGAFPHLVNVIFLMIPIVIICVTSRNRYAPGIAALAAAFTGLFVHPYVQAGSHAERSFFGVARVVDLDGYRLMMHGTTLHGAQRLEDKINPAPLAYYHDTVPIGQVFNAWEADAKTVGVIGLGAGAVACQTTRKQDVVFYEIDPLVAKLAQDESKFQFLSSCTPDARIVLGDGRLTIQDEPEGYFDLLLLDAFSSGSVPTHLLTREAVQIYFSRMSEDGVVVLHISNRYLDLPGVVARIAAEEGLVAKYQKFTNRSERSIDILPSQVAILARSEEALARLEGDERWHPLVSDGKRAWTDDYTNVIGAMLDQ